MAIFLKAFRARTRLRLAPPVPGDKTGPLRINLAAQILMPVAAQRLDFELDGLEAAIQLKRLDPIPL